MRVKIPNKFLVEAFNPSKHPRDKTGRFKSGTAKVLSALAGAAPGITVGHHFFGKQGAIALGTAGGLTTLALSGQLTKPEKETVAGVPAAIAGGYAGRRIGIVAGGTIASRKAAVAKHLATSTMKSKAYDQFSKETIKKTIKGSRIGGATGIIVGTTGGIALTKKLLAGKKDISKRGKAITAAAIGSGAIIGHEVARRVFDYCHHGRIPGAVAGSLIAGSIVSSALSGGKQTDTLTDRVAMAGGGTAGWLAGSRIVRNAKHPVAVIAPVVAGTIAGAIGTREAVRKLKKRYGKV